MAHVNSKEENIKTIKGLIVIIIVFSIYWTMCRDKSTTKTGSTYEKKEAKKIGEIVTVGNFTYRVDGIAYTPSLGGMFVKSKADGIYLAVELSVRNDDKKEHMLDNALFKLTDENGTEYESSIDGNTSLELSGHHTLFLKQLNPGIMKHGILVFEVPTRNYYYLHLSGGILSGEEDVVALVKQ